jgi:hypothetical protein
MMPAGRSAPPTSRSFSPGIAACLSAVVAAAFFLAGCATADPRDQADFGLKGLADGDEKLAVAALITEYVADPYSRCFLYTRLADEYQKRGQIPQALRMVRRADTLSRTKAAAPRRYQLQLELANYFIAYQRGDQARAVLKEALDQIVDLENEQERGQALEAVILACFRGKDAFNDLLRVAIDNVYAIYDPEFRVQLLTELGEKYQEQDSSNRANTFIQQSLAAASGIANPWARALADARIGSRLLREGNQEEGSAYFDLALREMAGQEILSMGSGDAQSLLNTVILLAENGRMADATTALARFPNSDQRVGAMLAVIQRYLADKNLLPARLLVQRLLNQLSQDDPDARQELSLSTLVRLAELYQSAGSPADAARYAQAAFTYLSSPLIAGTAQYRSRLAIVMARLGRGEEAVAAAGLITDSYVASQTLRQLGIELRQPLLLKEAVREAEQASYLKESALAASAVSLWQTGSRLDSLAILKRVQDPFTLASSFADALAWKDGTAESPLTMEEETALYAIAADWFRRQAPAL